MRMLFTVDAFIHRNGELYFELHRGTYTTQAALKHHNRLCEFLLRDAEMLCTLAHVIGGGNSDSIHSRDNWLDH